MRGLLNCFPRYILSFKIHMLLYILEFKYYKSG